MRKKKPTDIERHQAWIEARLNALNEKVSVLIVLVLTTLMAIPIVASAAGSGSASPFFGATLNTVLLYGLVAANFVNFIFSDL